MLTLIEEWALCPEFPCHHLIGIPSPPPPSSLLVFLHSWEAGPHVGHCGWQVQVGPCLGSPFLPLLQVVSSNPYLGDGRGAASLRLLKVMHQNIHPLLGQRWETTVPVLLEYLDGKASEPKGTVSHLGPHLHPVCHQSWKK